MTEFCINQRVNFLYEIYLERLTQAGQQMRLEGREGAGLFVLHGHLQ